MSVTKIKSKKKILMCFYGILYMVEEICNLVSGYIVVVLNGPSLQPVLCNIRRELWDLQKSFTILQNRSFMKFAWFMAQTKDFYHHFYHNMHHVPSVVKWVLFVEMLKNFYINFTHHYMTKWENWVPIKRIFAVIHHHKQLTLWQEHK